MQTLHSKSLLRSAGAAALAVYLSMICPGSVLAVPVLLGTEGFPGIDIAQRDTAGVLRTYAADDDNADGAISLVADLDPALDPVVHIKNGPSASQSVILLVIADRQFSDPLPFFITGTVERTITKWNALPEAGVTFTLGQPITVVDGQIPGLDAIIYRSPGISSAADVVDLDTTALATFSGPLIVGGLLRYQVVPEPSMLALTVCGFAVALLLGQPKRRGRT